MSLPIFPATDFDTVIEAYLKGSTVYMPTLAYFDFLDDPVAVCALGYDLVSGSVTWKGLGRSGFLIQIEGLADSARTEASDMTFTVSGTDAGLIVAFKDEHRAVYVNRMVCVYAQFCDANWQPLCPPYAVRAGFMGQLPATRTYDEEAKSWMRTIQLSASNIFFGRGNAPASFFTDRDQKLRHPGDRFCEFVASIQETSLNVPWRRG